MRTSIEEDGREGASGLSRDQKLVMEMNIPFTVDEIINKPMEEFNDILSKHSVSEEIINVCRDIRRRGKNKVFVSVWPDTRNDLNVSDRSTEL